MTGWRAAAVRPPADGSGSVRRGRQAAALIPTEMAVRRRAMMLSPACDNNSVMDVRVVMPPELETGEASGRGREGGGLVMLERAGRAARRVQAGDASSVGLGSSRCVAPPELSY